MSVLRGGGSWYEGAGMSVLRGGGAGMRELV